MILAWNMGGQAILAIAACFFLQDAHAFVSPSGYRASRPPFYQVSRILPGFVCFQYRQLQFRQRRRSPWPLRLNLDSNDPFQVLGLDEPTSDKKVIKRAYKRMALQYHPDVATTKDSTPEEKKVASDRFAKINWAYEVLSGKRQNDATYGPTSSSSSTTSGGSGWTPPHRRSGAYSSTSSGGTTNGEVDWTDFMPKYKEEDYDTNGDSFEKILSDLFVGAAAGAAGLGGGANIFRDFIDFLEGNVDGYGSDDSELRILLQTGSLDDVRNELDDTELVVQQLKSKLSDINDEILTTTAKAKVTSRYMDKIELEESLAELEARKEVVQGYVKKAQKRLLSLQTRYKELLTSGGRDPYGSSRSSRSTWDDIKSEAGSTGSASSSYSSSTADPTSSTSSSSSSASSDFSSRSQQAPKSDKDAWMNESFGSSTYGRRGSGRQRSRRSPSTSSASSSSGSRQTAQPQPEPTRASSRSSSAGSPGSSDTRQSTASTTSPGSPTSTSIRSTANSANSNVPPHRRTSGSYENKQEKDKRRLRELKVDEEFDRLKKDLGL